MDDTRRFILQIDWSKFWKWRNGKKCKAMSTVRYQQGDKIITAVRRRK